MQTDRPLASNGQNDITDVRTLEAKCLAQNNNAKIQEHLLRHSSGSMVYWRTGGDVKATQAWLGHSNSWITLDTYTHAAIDQQQKAAQQLAQGLFVQPKAPAQERTEVACGLSCALATLSGWHE